MADRRTLATPGGVHVRVSAARVQARLDNGWREVTPKPKPKPKASKPTKTDDE